MYLIDFYLSKRLSIWLMDIMKSHVLQENPSANRILGNINCQIMHSLIPGGKTKSLAKLPNLLWKPLLSAWIIFRAITSCKQMILQNLFLLPSVICAVWSIQVTADYINCLMKVGFFLNGIQYCFYHHSNSQLICANFSDLSNGWIFTVSPAKSQLFSLSSRIWQWAWFQNIQAWQFRQNHERRQTFVPSFLSCNVFFQWLNYRREKDRLTIFFGGGWFLTWPSMGHRYRGHHVWGWKFFRRMWAYLTRSFGPNQS
jgi:hypothetical protein